MGNIKIKTKQLLLGNTLKTFFVCALSFILRWSSIASTGIGIYAFSKSVAFENLINRLGNTLFYTSFALAVLVLLLSKILFCSALKAGEELFLFKKAINENTSLRNLFSFFSPKKSFSALSLYTQMGILKLFWFIYYIIPPAICTGFIFYLYSFANLPKITLAVLISGATLLFFISFYLFKLTSQRYAAAPFFFTAGNFPQKEAIKKSCIFLDGVLNSSLKLKLSFSGWHLSNIFILPLFYTVPYYRLCNSLFIAESVKNNIIKLCKHI